VDGEEEFTVHSLANHREANGSFEYLVRWLGYGPEHNTWEPQSNLEDTEAFERYWQAQGLEPPVPANSKQKIKACTAKVVYEAQEATFRRIWPAKWCRAGSLWRAEASPPTGAAVLGSPTHAQNPERTLTLLYRE
jgi:Chromo (CHRromatin Organisation MOdifier) domain